MCISKNKIFKKIKKKERVKLMYISMTKIRYNLNLYMCNCVVFNCIVHMYRLYTSIFIQPKLRKNPMRF